VIVRRTLTRTEKGGRFVLGEPNLRYTASYGEFTQDRLTNPLAATLWPYRPRHLLPHPPQHAGPPTRILTDVLSCWVAVQLQ
jgi:hypothetical protein